ncbi:asparagine--tRNA ligase [Arcticibacter tournemirensis]|uniref:Asparagine--tRNA ligase n=1 Tax=Arcticibacter tournemirensis TaxID=699437 RepID=A0A4Q0MCE4_9SPHI|nr:asparagine--tRNA ligase [Arcticibacter tournemirensis]RXF71018.1 asparagine--tRNA ligase [Arcticibacter tournemirensis]
MKRTKIKDLLNATEFGQQVTVKGWVRTFRNNQFIAINDGSSINNIQAVVDFTSTDESLLKRLTTGAAVSVTGELVESLGKGQRVEIKVGQLEILGDCDAEKYPLQPKKHSLEFLREIAHLRFRTNTFNAVFKVRNALAFAIHKFFNEQGFVYMHSPIITGSDAEGAGEMFRVTTIDLDNIPRNEDGSVNYKEDFFGKSTNLTVSGQLEGELAALAFGEIYTFGPTFRAENSNTTRHLAEFWMIEPEMAFYDLNDNMDLAESLLKYVIRYALDNCGDELEFLKGRLLEEEKQKPQNERSDLDLISKLNFCLENSFERITYTEAINILKSSKPNQKKQFKYLIEDWGADLQSEHERYLVEKHFKKPVILTDYPADIKAFYMKQNDADDQGRNTVRAMDILFPGIGEIVGGSQREEVLEKLERRMTEMHIPVEEMSWFLDTRRFGSVPHSGFGLGFERLVLFVTGMTNIRDVIPFPRTPKNAEF